MRSRMPWRRGCCRRSRLQPGAERGVELTRALGADEYRDPPAESQLHAVIAAGRICPARGPETHAPTTVLEEGPVPPNLKADDVLESKATRRPQVAERDSDAVVGAVDVGGGERDERGPD